MSIDYKIVPITEGNYTREKFAALLKKSQAEGYNLVLRFGENWDSGDNRFNLPGEAFFGVENDGRLIGMGGRSIDPYLNDTRAVRVRHVYLLPEWRRLGIGEALMKRIMDVPAGQFKRMTLRTLHIGARKFYEKIGFQYVGEGDVTHEFEL
ncbi:MAG TPA: GNAT family N-acetyltransferase [Patescibacteria group bacterium]|nr:GNAT family N-acetyltransferase [Patescibacteria group bacterium]